MDPREIVDKANMSRFQWTAVFLMIGLNALDGFDVLSISYASPGIAAAWGIDRAALGIVLSMELVGMAFGALFLGNVADAIGRRKTIIGCLVVMSGGMFAAAAATDITTLCFCRLITGLGIGGMLASINAAVAEAANAKRRALCVVLMSAGLPIGSVIGGLISGELLKVYDWPAVFILGGMATAAFLPLVLWLAPESIAFEMHKRSPGALERINKTLNKMGHAAIDALPEVPAIKPKAGLSLLFSKQFAALAILLALAYFMHIITFYYIIKWIPKIVVDMGFAPPTAAGVLVWASIGGSIGALTLGLLTLKARITALTIGAMLASTAAVIVFGQGWETLEHISIAAAVAGFFTNAPIVGLYAIVAQSFPTQLRATATGFIIGLGRGGAALAPVIAGFLFQAGWSLPTVSIMMGLAATIAALMLFLARGRIAAAAPV
ncbi:MFS transporter [Brevundimonas variabilis]|uniref:Benzoate transport n=1 Tax=Brevundimonas variabilis TaxID=74312 RepID=A0A7W9CK33_9CAUL|nr:MFS transporter [Brevundimonas variabilis]MBB5747001.1 benzoate transport [Brevundimonas variabilis]